MVQLCWYDAITNDITNAISSNRILVYVFFHVKLLESI
jgi:hypothetical protein